MIETLVSLAQKAGHDISAPQPELEQRSDGSISSAFPGSSAYEALTFGTPTITGRSINPNTAMSYSAVWCAVKLLSETLASLPLYTYRNLSPDGLLRRFATDDYRYRLLREQPNEEMTSFQWRVFMMQSLLLWGNSYSYLELDGRGRVTAIWPLRPDSVIVLRNPRTLKLEYRYTPNYPFAVPVLPGVYSPDQICHISGLSFDGIQGYSPITIMRNSIAIAGAYEEFAGRTLASGGVPRVALIPPAGVTIKDPEALRREWTRENAGLSTAGKVTVLQSGMTVQSIGLPLKDCQFLEGRSFQVSEIARMYNIPIGMLHDALSKPDTYASSEQNDLRFVKYTLRPYARSIEEKLNLTVLSSQDALTCRHEFSDLLRGDLASQASSYSQLCGSGIMTRNEARIRIDLPPDNNPAADELTTQAQYIKLGSEQGPATTPEPALAPPQAEEVQEDEAQ